MPITETKSTPQPTAEPKKSVRLLYSCSGAANTGNLADEIARRLAREGVGKMTCLVSVGAGLPRFLEEAKTADELIVIDGCPISCGQIIFAKLGIPIRHFATTEEGVEKNKTPITEELIETVKESIKHKIEHGE